MNRKSGLDPYLIYIIQNSASAFLLAMIFTVNQVYQVSMAGLTPLQLVLVGTFLELSVFLFEVPTGVVADTYSRRLSVIIGYNIIGFSFIVEGSLPFFGAIALGQGLWGLGYTFTSGALDAWISDEIGEEHAAGAFLRASQARQLGGLLGIGASVILGQGRVNIPIVAGGVAFLFLGGVLIWTMPERNFQPTSSEMRNSWSKLLGTFQDGLRLMSIRRLLVLLLGIVFFFGLYSEGFDRLWTKHILDDLSLPLAPGWSVVTWFGMIRAGGMVLSVLSTEVVRRKVNTANQASMLGFLTGAALTLILGIVLFAQGRSFWLALALVWLISMAREAIGPLLTAWVNQMLDSRVRSTVLSMSSQVDAIGQIAGGPLVGLVGNWFSVRTAITLAGSLLIPVLYLFRKVSRFDNMLADPAVRSSGVVDQVE